MALKVGLVGVRRGSSLVRPFQLYPESGIHALCDTKEESLRDAAAAFGVPPERCYTSFDAMLASGIDIAVVGTPIPFHAEQSIKALEAGVHVLSEVTAANSLEELDAILAAARASSAQYMMAENMCYVHYIMQWKDLVRSGRIGEIVYAECEYLHNIETLMIDEKSGEAYWRLQRPPIQYCTHSLGPVLQMMDDHVTEVSCVSGGYRTVGVEAPGTPDMQVALMKTARGGVIKLLRSQVIRREPTLHAYALYGTGGFLEHDHSKGYGDVKGRLYVEGEHDHAEGYEEIALPYTNPDAPEEARSGGHGTSEYELVRDFLDAIEANRRPPIDAVMAARMTAPGLVAVQSAVAGGAWMPVPHYDW
jgi:predicted dehydrogenase